MLILGIITGSTAYCQTQCSLYKMKLTFSKCTKKDNGINSQKFKKTNFSPNLYLCP